MILFLWMMAIIAFLLGFSIRAHIENKRLRHEIQWLILEHEMSLDNIDPPAWNEAFERRSKRLLGH